MRGLSSEIYDKNYYLKYNLGFEEYKKYKGRKISEETKKFANLLGDVKGKKILDLGCGRGDLVFELARKGANVIGVDYSKDGIELANDALEIQETGFKKRIKFYVLDAKELDFNQNTFDIIVSYDVFEHLYREELEVVMRLLSKVLKPNGLLFVHTATNKIYLDFTHKFWCYWLDYLLLKFNKIIFNKEYPSLDKDPRNDIHKQQHVNEPTFFYLRSLFERYKFNGQIKSIVPYKPNLSWKDKIYNIIVYLYPFSNYLPLNLFFTTEYICKMRNNKK